MRIPRRHSHPIISSRAKEMRHNSAPAEALLWSRLRAGQVAGLRFRRQHPIDRFILDFFCPAARVAIELDGDSHMNRLEYDDMRTNLLESNDITVIRFLNSDVFDHLSEVLEQIFHVCQTHLNRQPNPSPQPSPAGGEGETQ